jgi:lipoprotein NlpI
VVFNHPRSRQINWRMIGDRTGSPPTPTETFRGELRTLDFDERGLRETVVDQQTPQDYFAFRFLQFSEFASWNEVAQWATALFEIKTAPNEEIDGLANKIGTLDSDGNRVTAALQILQSEIRYFSVSLGESSHRPASPDIVLRRRYGDCKDKSLLLVTLLQRLGIKSRPVLLQTGRRRGLEEVLPSPEFFDHVIVEAVVDGKSYFLDPTRLGQTGRLDRMGQAHEGIQILPVAADTERPSSIPVRATDQVEDDLTERVTVTKLGDDAQLSLKRVWSGLSAERLRVAFEQTTREMAAKRIGDMLEGKYPGAKLTGEPALHDDQELNILSLEANFRVPKLAAERNGTWIIGYKPDNQAGALPLPSSATRTTPLGISAYPYHARYAFEITLPEEVSVVADPYTETVANDHFSLTSSRYFRGNIARGQVELTTLRPFVETGNYLKYADDLRAANRAIVGYFAFGKGDIKSSEAGADQTSDRFQRMLLDAVKKTTETISSGKLTGSDLADALCQRGSSLAELGRADEALRDVNEAFRLIPNTSEAFNCRATTLYETGQFERSITDLSKAISLGSINAVTYRARGAARFYAGQFEQAASDFARAAELAEGDGKVYCELWLVAALGRAGTRLPDEIVQRAGASIKGPWPMPALAMMTGALSPDDLLKTFDDKKGDERRMLLSEAHFYIGQHDMMRGDKEAAKLSFEKSREQGVILYVEHIAAGFELQRLAKEGAGVAAAKPLP